MVVSESLSRRSAFSSLPEEGMVEGTAASPFAQDEVFGDRLWRGFWHEPS